MIAEGPTPVNEANAANPAVDLARTSAEAF